MSIFFSPVTAYLSSVLVYKCLVFRCQVSEIENVVADIIRPCLSYKFTFVGVTFGRPRENNTNGLI